MFKGCVGFAFFVWGSLHALGSIATFLASNFVLRGQTPGRSGDRCSVVMQVVSCGLVPAHVSSSAWLAASLRNGAGDGETGHELAEVLEGAAAPLPELWRGPRLWLDGRRSQVLCY